LLPAQDSLFGFPIFKRHYWSDISIFAMATFLGKPAILVEHHDFFKNGPAKAEHFATEMLRLRRDMRWAPLYDVVTNTHLMRSRSETCCEVRFFTDIFKITNGRKSWRAYKFLRRLPDTSIVHRVVINGESISFSRHQHWLTFEATARAGERLHVEVSLRTKDLGNWRSFGIKYNAAVALRRGLSELRDNVISQSPRALRAAKALVSAIGRST
jgi:hypothetical protein